MVRLDYTEVRAGVARDPESEVARVFLWAKTAAGRRVQLVIRGNDAIEEREVDEGGRAAEPSLILPWMVLDALLADPQKDVGAAVADHLQDAVKVRDRLLVLVEKMVEKRWP